MHHSQFNESRVKSVGARFRSEMENVTDAADAVCVKYFEVGYDYSD